MKEKNINSLLQKFERGECDAEDMEVLDTWYLHYGAASDFETSDEQLEKSTQQVWNRLVAAQAPAASFPIWYKIAAAAVVIFTLSIALFYLYPASPTAPQLTSRDLPPGSHKAILTLSDGTKVDLDGTSKGAVAQQQGVLISKEDNGMLVYEMKETSEASAAVAMNTIETPNGGEYKVVLPDGTHIWLNAASKLKFPASFKNQKERSVELQGEAYFEVAKNKSQPFIVRSKGQTVEVTGTHFNVNAYTDEPYLKTTLVEGSVLVNNQQLKPGQEALVTGAVTTVNEADVEVETAWKNGDFVFNGSDLPGVLRKISRWYDIEIVYAVQPKTRLHFEGEFSRKSNLSAIIAMLEATGEVKFEIKGRRVILIK